MNRRWVQVILLLLFVLGFPLESWAPLIYRPGEGWVYEAPGHEGKWTRTTAKGQLEVAQQAFLKKDYSLALKAARRTVKVWPLSDPAPQAQYLLGRCYQAKGQLDTAFKAYQTLLEKYPKVDNYQEVLVRQFEIANEFLAGHWFRVFDLFPLYPSMDRTAKLFEAVIRNGPYSAVAPRAQLNIGAARERQSSWFNRVDAFKEAVTAYEKGADRYHENAPIASEALFKTGRAYFKQANKADYDQSVAGKAIATFSDFLTLYPDDPRGPEARRMIAVLKTEQARGAFSIARYYEKRKRWKAALIYYNETTVKDRDSPYAQVAKQRMEEIRKLIGVPTAQK
jgi:outer membrane protein assembly factor BamD